MRRYTVLPLLLVTACAIVLGFAAWRGFDTPGKPDYRADLPWQARWVSASDAERTQAYFRGKLFLVERPAHAWVAVMAPDEYELRVNGHIVGTPVYRSGYAQQVFEITPYLVAGTNVLAVRNTISTFPQRARIVVQGQYQDRAGRTVDLESNARWKAVGQDMSLVSEDNAVRSVKWFDADYDDGNWPPAVVGDVPAERPIQRFDFPTELITRMVPYEWIWAPDPDAREAYFRLTLDLDERPRDAWLRLGVKRHHRLLVNGRVVAIEEKTLGTVKAAKGNLLNLYDLTPWLRAGRNVVAVHASNDMVDRGLMVDGFVQATDGTRRWFSLSDWKVSPTLGPDWTSPAYDDGAWTYASPTRPTLTREQEFLDRTVVDVPLALSLQLERAAHVALFVGGAIGAAVLLWLALARVLSIWTGVAARALRGGVATIFLAPALLLGAAYVVGFDGRFPASFAHDSRLVLGGIGLLIGLGLVLLYDGARAAGRDVGGTAAARRWWRLVGAWPTWAFLAALTLVGLILRVHNLTFEPIHHDEGQQLLWIQGLLERGYPSVVLEGRAKAIFTSELAIYLKTPFVWLLGPTELGSRLCELIFGVLTIPLVYRVGRMLYDARVGTLAAIVYTFLPSAIGMTHHGRYPSPQQFFALLTVALLFQAVRGGTLRPRPYWGAVAAFIATYLTWEGAAFFFPALTLGVVALTRPRFSWLRSGHMWGGVGVIACVAITQFSLRLANQQEWQIYGSSIYDVTLAPMWRYPFYAPGDYLTKFFFLENHGLLTLLFLAGIPLWWRRSRSGRVLAFLGTTVVVTVLLMVHLLEVAEWRYVYYLLPLTIISATLVLVVFFERLGSLCARLGASGRALRGVAGATAVVVAVLVPVLSTSYVVQLYDLPWAYGAQYTRLGARNNAGLSGPAAFLRENKRPGDLVVAVSPEVLEHYGVHADYYVETRLRLPLLLSTEATGPMNRHTGVPTLLSPADLREAYGRGARIWVVSFGSRWPNPELGPALEQSARVAYEDWQTTVFLMGKPVTPLSPGVTAARAEP